MDKFYRLSHGYGWWEDEQTSDEIKAYVERQIAEKHFDVILSHTCPFKYEPTEVFLPMIDQSTVDAGTEHWLDKIEEAVEYKAWFCGHWHIDKRTINALLSTGLNPPNSRTGGECVREDDSRIPSIQWESE